MLDLIDYAPEEVLYTGPQTQVIRALHRPSGARAVVKQPVAAAPSARVVGRLIHEHDMLVKLAPVAQVAKVRALEQRGGVTALVLEDPGLRSLDRVLAEQGRLPVAYSGGLGHLFRSDLASRSGAPGRRRSVATASPPAPPSSPSRSVATISSLERSDGSGGAGRSEAPG
jgi:hypothetical protein